MRNSRQWFGGMIGTVLIGMVAATPLLVSPARGQDAPTTRPAADRPRGRGPSLGSDMRSMGQAFGKIRAQYKDPTQNESTLTYLATFEAQAAAAKSLLPPTITAMTDEDAKKKATDEYRGMMRSLIRAALDLEDQITTGDMDKAAASIATMGTIEKTGHAEFRPK